MKSLAHPGLAAPLAVAADDGRHRREDLIAWYWQNHPRFRFLKMSAPGGRFLDIGAGSGGLSFWRDWQAPARPDLELHGCDLYPAQFASRYAAFHVLDFDARAFPYPDGHFDSALCSHVIEHLREPAHLAAEAQRLLKPGGAIYLETPTEESRDFPPRDFFLAGGVPTTTINFFDDATHTAVVSRDSLAELFMQAGFSIREAGTIRMPYLEDLLLAKAAADNDQELGSYGLWSRLGFAHYAIFQKPGA